EVRDRPLVIPVELAEYLYPSIRIHGFNRLPRPQQVLVRPNTVDPRVRLEYVNPLGDLRAVRRDHQLLARADRAERHVSLGLEARLFTFRIEPEPDLHELVVRFLAHRIVVDVEGHG